MRDYMNPLLDCFNAATRGVDYGPQYETVNKLWHDVYAPDRRTRVSWLAGCGNIVCGTVLVSVSGRKYCVDWHRDYGCAVSPYRGL